MTPEETQEEESRQRKKTDEEIQRLTVPPLDHTPLPRKSLSEFAEPSVENVVKLIREQYILQAEQLKQLSDLLNQMFQRVDQVLKEMYLTMETMRIVIGAQDEILDQLTISVQRNGTAAEATIRAANSVTQFLTALQQTQGA